MNIVKLNCSDYTIDWIRDKEVEIDVDKYVFFEIDYRGGESSWYLIGHKYNKEKEKWETENFDYYICSIYNMAVFIAKVNNIKDEFGQKRNRISRFNNLHYTTDFYEELKKLLELVKRYEVEQ